MQVLGITRLELRYYTDQKVFFSWISIHPWSAFLSLGMSFEESFQKAAQPYSQASQKLGQATCTH